MPPKKRSKTTKKRTVRKIPHQVGKSDSVKDRRLKSKLPGYRTSASGNVYYENRKNRSDTAAERQYYAAIRRVAKRKSNRGKVKPSLSKTRPRPRSR